MGSRAPYAPFWRRLVAWLIDEAAKTFLYLFILIVEYIVTGTLPDSASSTELDFLALAPRLVLSLGYDWIFWSQGWTPGAGLMGMRIVRADGAHPGPLRGGVRVVFSVPSGAALFLGYLWMLWSPKKQTWHDMAAGTYVITVRDGDERRPRGQ